MHNNFPEGNIKLLPENVLFNFNIFSILYTYTFAIPTTNLFKHDIIITCGCDQQNTQIRNQLHTMFLFLVIDYTVYYPYIYIAD